MSVSGRREASKITPWLWRAAFGAVLLGCLSLAYFDAGLSWDGSYWLVRILDSQAPLNDLGRLSNYVLQLPLGLALRLTDDASLLKTLFNLTYALLPLGALCLTAWFLTPEKKSLLVFAFMGVCIAQLGGRFFLVAEADLAVDFTWPILLGGFVRQTRWQRLAWLTVIFFVAFIHPTSFLLFAACAAALGVASWDQPQCRRPALLLLIASGARFWLFRSGWDPIPEGAGEWGYLKYQLTTSLVHGLIFSIAGGWVACVGILGMYASRSFLRRVSQTLVVLGLLVSLVSSLYWAKDISHWALAVGFRGAALFIGSAFLAIGALAAWRFTEQGGNWAGGVALAAALIFSSTVSVQGYRWQQAIARFEALLRESPHACIERAAVMQFEGTPIPYWHLLSLAIVVQGRAPKTLIQEDGGCAKAAETGRIMLAPWHPRELSSRGWYQFPTQASLSNGDAPNRQLP